MKTAVQELTREAGWKVRALLRCRRFYTISELVRLYKAQVLSYIEARTPAIHHAARSTLDQIDRVQRRFLRSVGVSKFKALIKYRFMPLPARRDMAMLGLWHRFCHGFATRPLAVLFPWSRERQSTVPTRDSEVRHGRQLAEFGAIGGDTEVICK